ncbi:MAG: Rieske 2Fe-2S domain-containing protein [Frankia sp.]|nr:Rieske 2Fe-2S domain-containing protein [Frankia sp.]
MRSRGLDLEMTGWYQVAWSGEIGPEQVVPLRYLGRDLVAYRGKDGVVRVHDRYCRHLGASLAHGGCVVDDGLRCPFHGWVWGPDGRNVSIPYQGRPNKAGRLHTWTTVERNESIYIWFDPAGREPYWDVPDMLAHTPQAASRQFHPAWPDGRAFYPDLHTHPRIVIENAVDLHHFRFIHHTAMTPILLEQRTEGPLWWTRAGFGRGWAKHPYDADGEVRSDTMSTIEIFWTGLGVSMNVEHTAAGVRVVSINVTPVEDERCALFATYWIDRNPGDLEDGTYQRRLAEAKALLPGDIDIWKHQIYVESPVLATEEGALFRRLRRWTAQFYPGHTPEPAAGGPSPTTASA